jgi:hypothetical protein
MKMDFRNITWSDFFVEALFNVKIGKSVDGNKVNKKTGQSAYITRKESNNGLDGFVNADKIALNRENPVITIGNETAEPFVQDFPFYTGTKVNILNSKVKISRLSLLFISQCLKLHKNKYSYSFSINSTRLKRQKILLPTTSDGQPDYAFMEQYMRNQEQEKLKAYKNHITENISELKTYKEVLPFAEKKWREFNLNEIFKEIQRGKRLKKGDHIIGKTPYISSTGLNNGVDNFVGNKNKVRIFSDCLTIANSGSVGVCFYQPFNFVASDHITKLYNNQFNKYIYLFISTITSRLGKKYSFNREINDNRIQKEKIMLPINSKNQPDYEYIENYMKKLEYNKLTKYMEHKDL